MPMPNEESATEPLQYFVFVYREIQYALPVTPITEIIRVSEWLPFAGDLPGCFGNIVHRDLLLPVLDPTVLGTDLTGEPAKPTTVIVIRHDDTVFGLAIDEHVAVVTLEAHAKADPGGRPAIDKARASEGAAAQPESKPFVESVRAYLNNTLITLSVAAIGSLVKPLYSDQRLISESGGERQEQDASAAAEAMRHSFMCARIEDAALGIPVEQVMEVIEDYDVTPVFKVTPHLRGLINLRGQVIACFDISQELGFPLRRLDERNQFIVLQGDGAELALCVDGVLGLHPLPHDRIQPAETVLSGEITRYVHGVLETEQDTILILSVADVFESPHLQPYLRQEE